MEIFKRIKRKAKSALNESGKSNDTSENNRIDKTSKKYNNNENKDHFHPEALYKTTEKYKQLLATNPTVRDRPYLEYILEAFEPHIAQRKQLLENQNRIKGFFSNELDQNRRICKDYLNDIEEWNKKYEKEINLKKDAYQIIMSFEAMHNHITSSIENIKDNITTIYNSEPEIDGKKLSDHTDNLVKLFTDHKTGYIPLNPFSPSLQDTIQSHNQTLLEAQNFLERCKTVADETYKTLDTIPPMVMAALTSISTVDNQLQITFNESLFSSQISIEEPTSLERLRRLDLDAWPKNEQDLFYDYAIDKPINDGNYNLIAQRTDEVRSDHGHGSITQTTWEAKGEYKILAFQRGEELSFDQTLEQTQEFKIHLSGFPVPGQHKEVQIKQITESRVKRSDKLKRCGIEFLEDRTYFLRNALKHLSLIDENATAEQAYAIASKNTHTYKQSLQRFGLLKERTAYTDFQAWLQNIDNSLNRPFLEEKAATAFSSNEAESRSDSNDNSDRSSTNKKSFDSSRPQNHTIHEQKETPKIVKGTEGTSIIAENILSKLNSNKESKEIKSYEEDSIRTDTNSHSHSKGVNLKSNTQMDASHATMTSTKIESMQIERQTKDMKRDTHERASIKEFVSDFLLSEHGIPIESAMLQAIPQDKDKKLRFPVDQREAQAMKQLVDACYALDNFATKIKDIDSHLSDLPKNTDKTDNTTVVPYSNERILKMRQVLEHVKSRFAHIKEFYNFEGLQKSVEDTEILLRTPKIGRDDEDNNTTLSGDNLIEMWTRDIVVNLKYDKKCNQERQNQVRKGYGFDGASGDPKDWEHESGTQPLDLARAAKEQSLDKIKQYLPHDSIVRRKIIECATTRLNKEIKSLYYDSNKWNTFDTNTNKFQEMDPNDEELIFDFTKMKNKKHEDNET